MSPHQRQARTEILTRLLDAYERSSSFASDGPWRRNIILKLDHATFPDAFAPDGRERRAELLEAASDLERKGAVRIVGHVRGPLAGEPKEMRIGAAEVNQAYALAATFGYEPLTAGLSQIERHVRSLASKVESQFAKSFLENLATGLRSGDLSAIGMGRSKFKQEWRALAPALTAALALLRGVTPAWERVISERLFHDSKLLGRIRHHVINLLLRIDPRWDGIPSDEASDLLEAYGVRRKPGLLQCAGSATIRVGGRDYLLEDFTPVAHLPDAWSDAWVEALASSRVQVVTTIENEYPFLSYVEEAGGPRNLGAQGEVAIYTAGFPTPALIIALRTLSERMPDLKFRHWGDADVGGLRIWWFLRCRLERPVALFRTTAAWVESELHRGGRRLSTAEIEGLRRLKSIVVAETNEDTASASELIDKLLEHGIRIEQERY
jgi:Wadjet anti plasmid transformation system JetA-like protein